MADKFSVMAASMQADLHKVNVSSQNISNVNTPAYKRQVSFSQWLGDTSQPQTTTLIDKSHGIMTLTNGKYDLAISGAGYFVLNEEGEKLITRHGAFKVDPEGYLVLGQNQRVQGGSGDIFVGNQELRVEKNGDIFLDNEFFTQIEIALLPSAADLIPKSANTYLHSGHIQNESSEQQYQLHQGYLEKSNVDAKLEMLNLVETMRHFELQQKVLRSYNSMIDVGITDLGSF